LIFDLLDHNDAVNWENERAYTFLRALASWLEDRDGFYRNIGDARDSTVASWQLFADALGADPPPRKSSSGASPPCP
jgi:hypothetical protein